MGREKMQIVCELDQSTVYPARGDRGSPYKKKHQYVNAISQVLAWCKVSRSLASRGRRGGAEVEIIC